MSDDTSAALIAQLDVKFDKLASNMKSAIKVFDDGGRQLERRQKKIKDSLSDWSLDFSGLSRFKGELLGLTAAGIVGGLGLLVKNSLEAAGAIGDTAVKAGVGIERLQALRFAASQSGASFELMDTALTTLNKNLGDFVNTGAGKSAATFKALGIDKMISAGQVRDAETAFDAIVKKLQGVQSEAQKSAYLASVFGKEAGPNLLQLVNEGAGGIADLEAKARSLGVVLSEQTVRGAKEAGDKLDALFTTVKTIGINAIAQLAPEIANLSQEITDSLPGLIMWAEKWASIFGLIKLSPVQKLTIELADARAELERLQQPAKVLPGFFAFLNRASVERQKSVVKNLEAELALAPITSSPMNSYFRGYKPSPRLKPYKAPISPTAGIDNVSATPGVKITESEFDKLSFAAQRNLVAIKAEGEAFGMTAGQAEAYRWKMEALQQIHASGADATEDQVKVLDYLATAMGNAADANDRLRQADEAYRQQIQETNAQQEQMKNSLVDVFAEGIHGFGALKNAGAQFLDQLALMVIKTQVLGPLFDNIFGGDLAPVRSTPMNSAFSGGLFGGLLSAIGIPGFANGTSFAPGGLALVGERGPELVNLPRGSQVVPHVGRVGAAASASPVFHFDLRGAVVTQDLIDQMNQIGKQAADTGARRGASMALAAQPARQQSFAALGT